MRLAAKLTGGRRGRRKSFAEPPFWALDQFPFMPMPGSPDREQIDNNFVGYIEGAYKASGPVFATAITRAWLFAQARLQWQELRNGRPSRPFGTPELAILERPWLNGTTADLLARLDQDVTVSGNSFWTTVDDAGRYGRAATGTGRRLTRMRPDWTSIIKGSRSGDPRALDAKVIALEYAPPAGIDGRKPEPLLLLPRDVAHYAPVTDPQAQFRGMSWLTPVIREIQADRAASKHKVKFFENGATMKTVVSLDKEATPEDFDAFVDRFKAQHEGVDTAYKTLFVGGGADLTVVGADMQQIDFKVTQGAGETRIAAAAGMHPVVVGMSEGMQGSSLNAGNFDAAARLTADKTLRFLWLTAGASLERLVDPPKSNPNARLTYDDRDIPFLQDNEKDRAEVGQKQSFTIRTYTDAGFTPESAVDAVESGDLTRLKHTGLFSVQLQPPQDQASMPEVTTSDPAVITRMVRDGWTVKALNRPSPEDS